MKRKLLALLLAALMTVAVLPLSVFAGSYEQTQQGGAAPAEEPAPQEEEASAAGTKSGMRGDVNVTIGDQGTTGDNSYLPMNSLYEYSYTQQIYTADEIGKSGLISDITVWLKGNADLYEMPFDIYMLETDKDAFSSTSDWISVSASDKVYSGSVTVHNTAYEEYTFTLDTPFEYSGTGNLAVCFDNNTGAWKSGLNGKTFNAASGDTLSIYARRDSTDYDPTNISSVSASAITSARNVICLGFVDPSAATHVHAFTYTASGRPSRRAARAVTSPVV